MEISHIFRSRSIIQLPSSAPCQGLSSHHGQLFCAGLRACVPSLQSWMPRIPCRFKHSKSLDPNSQFSISYIFLSCSESILMLSSLPPKMGQENTQRSPPAQRIGWDSLNSFTDYKLFLTSPCNPLPHKKIPGTTSTHCIHKLD